MATIDYSDIDGVEPVPLDAQDVVTKVHLVIAGNRAGKEPTLRRVYDVPDEDHGDAFISLDYVPQPIVFTVEAPEHATYACERAFALPEGIDPFLPPDDAGVPEPDQVIGFTNPGSPSAVRDGDPTTHAELTDTGGGIRYQNVPGLYGFRLRYSLQLSTSASARADASVAVGPRLEWDPDLGAAVDAKYGQAAENVILATTDGDEVAEAYVVLPADARVAPVNLDNRFPPASYFGEPLVYQGLIGTALLSVTQALAMKVYAFYPLILNEPLLEDIARRQLRVPSLEPKRLIVKGHVPPDPEVTITGWPGGTITRAVAQVQYELGRTVIDFEQAGAPVGLPAEAIEAARERRVAIDRAVQGAAYAVRMGERQ